MSCCSINRKTRMSRFFFSNGEKHKLSNNLSIDWSAFASVSSTVDENQGKGGKVNTTKFPEEFQSRENLEDLRGMHLRRGNVTSRHRHRIYYNGCQTFSVLSFRSRAGAAQTRLFLKHAHDSPARNRERDSATSRDSRLNDLAASLCPAKSKPRRQIGFPIFIRGSREACRLARWISSDPSPNDGKKAGRGRKCLRAVLMLARLIKNRHVSWQRDKRRIYLECSGIISSTHDTHAYI